MRRGGRSIELGPEGIRHPRSALLGGELLTHWHDVTHVFASRGGIRLGTRRGAFLFRAADFREASGVLELAQLLRRGAASGAGGPERAARMVALDRLAANPGRALLAGTLVAVCTVAFLLQGLWPGFHHEGYFSATLVRVGEPWRIVTANLLHASTSHLLLNLAGLGVLGWLTERCIGSPRAALVAGAAALGAMLASYASGYERALGASGVVYGLAGALLCVEIRWPEAIPAHWRIPRRVFVIALAAETVVLMGLPVVAHAAHWGGFAGGGLAAAWLGPRPELAPGASPATRLVRVAGASLAVLVLLALGAFLQNVAAPDAAAVARRGERLLELDHVAADLLNNEAWQIAVAAEVEPGDLDVARRLAERAVDATDAGDPASLDTLAEIHFRAGRSERALELIDAAIGLAPGEPYYGEQRRRFLGERGPDDRPPDPRWAPAPDSEPELPPGPPGIRV
jgi:rhomboid protease GluP